MTFVLFMFAATAFGAVVPCHLADKARARRARLARIVNRARREGAN